MRLSTVFAPLVVCFGAISLVSGGPIEYGVCQTGCNTVAVDCYKKAGFVFGTVAAADALPIILTCNDGLGTCSKACANATLPASTPSTPTP